MFAALIIDDHPHLVESLTTVIPWNDLAVSRVETAHSGFEAMEVLQRQRIDLLITDIRMPGMSGLELIEQARAAIPDIQCVLLTGYSEFEYAKRAIELQAFRYLMKPVRREEMIQCVEEIVSGLIFKRKALQEQAERMPILQARLLDEWVAGDHVDDGEGEFDEAVGRFGLSLSSGDRFRFALLGPSHGASLSNTPIERLALLGEEFGSAIRTWVMHSAFGEAVFLLSPSEAEAEPDWRQVGTTLRDLVSGQLGVHAPVFISKQGLLPRDLRSIYHASLRTARSLHPYPSDVVIEEEMDVPNRKIDPLHALYQPPTLLQCVEAGNLPALSEKIGNVFQELHERWPYSLEHLRETLHHLLSAFTFMAHRKGRLLEEWIGPMPSLERAGILSSSHVLEQWASKVFLELADGMDEGKRESQHKLVELVQEYVYQHISGDLTLAKLAEHVYLHPVYLSKIYKETTGSNLSDYILTARMERAKDLLRHTTFKIYQIGESVGYRSTQHFISEFKKYVGVTPKQYRDT